MDNITKIKLEDQKTIIGQMWLDGDNERETIHRKVLERHPDFDKAMQALLPHVLKLLGLPNEYATGMKVKSISLSDNETQGMGVVITCLKELQNINAPLVLNTPHLHEDLSETGLSVMPDILRIELRNLIDEAKAYLNGKSAQMNMFEGKAA